MGGRPKSPPTGVCRNPVAARVYSKEKSPQSRHCRPDLVRSKDNRLPGRQRAPSGPLCSEALCPSPIAAKCQNPGPKSEDMSSTQGPKHRCRHYVSLHASEQKRKRLLKPRTAKATRWHPTVHILKSHNQSPRPLQTCSSS